MMDHQNPQALCIPDLLRAQAERIPEATAVSAPGRSSLTYGRLWSHAAEVVRTLNGIGIDRNDRIAMVLPDGPEMAVAFLAAASCATGAPLNPAYRADEFNSYLSDLKPKALMIQCDVDSPARAVARSRGLPVIELSPCLGKEAGIFDLAGEAAETAADSGLARPEDVAAILLTSGTTSRAKLVPLMQAYICTSADRARSVLQLRHDDRCLSIMPLFHVHGLIGALLSSVAAGATVICTPGLDAPKFFEWLEECRPTWYTAVPSMHQAILARAAANAATIARCPLRLIRSSSASLPLQVMAQLESTFHAPVIEAYGLTESFQITCNPLPPSKRKAGSVGAPANPEDIAIVNDIGRPLPAGEIGEIVIHQTKVASICGRGAARENDFINDWFKTGDQGFLDSDGYLFITGRRKEIINRAGEQISPYEIEQSLLDHPAVAQAVAFALPDTRLGEDIGAAVVLRNGVSTTADDIRRFLAARLADFKIPSRVLFLDEIPKTSSGKAQRIGLADRLGITPLTPGRRTAEFVAPRTPIERTLAAIWAEVLGLERVGIHADFFDSGGDSILAARLISRIREATQVDLPFVSFFEARTVAEIAQRVEQTRSKRPSSRIPSMEPAPRNHQVDLSFAQERFWFLNALDPDNPAYHISIVLSLTGPLDVAALERSLNEILRRHEALRTNFQTIDGRPVQRILPYHSVALPVVDLRKLPETERETKALELARDESNRPFHLSHDLLFRSKLLRVGDEESRLVVTVHHIVFDGWSVGVFFRELSALYEAFRTGRTPSLPELRIQYSDFAHWQRQSLQGEGMDRQLSYWREQLRGGSLLLELPTDRPRPPVRSYRGARRFLTLSHSLTAAIKTVGETEGATLFMTLLGAFQSLLHRYSGQDDISVGSPIANRNQIETEPLIGLFINMLVLRTDLSGDPTFSELLRRVKETAIGAYTNQDLPFEKLVSELRPERHRDHSPLFQVMFVLQNMPAKPPDLRDLAAQRLGIDRGTALYELTLELREGPDGLNGFIEYDTDLFDPDTIDRMAGHFQTLLEGIVRNPQQRLTELSMITKSERRRLVTEWNAAKSAYPRDRCIHELFEAQAKRSPHAIATVFEDRQLTYSELNRRANQLAHHLKDLGVGPGKLVGVCVERSLEMVIGLLAILKAGGAYVPLDPAYPKERLAFMMEDAELTALLTQERLLSQLPKTTDDGGWTADDRRPPHQSAVFGPQSSFPQSESCYAPRAVRRTTVICLDQDGKLIKQENHSDFTSGVTTEDLAYVIFTSGSTGKPKGVEIPHRAVVNFLHSMRREPGLAEHDTLLSVTTLSFDIAALEIFLPLTVGARVVIVNAETAADGTLLAQKLDQCGATAMQATPATWRLLLETKWEGSRRIKMLCGGEALNRSLAARLLGRGSSLWNLYGPTETTIWSTLCRIDSEENRIPIGRPIANTRVYLLDPSLQPVPIGSVGELYIGGAGLARGYLKRPDLTAEKFIPDPLSDEPGACLYKTGDLARYLPDGNIELLGRIDHQVKIRGFRIEPGEIEAVLAHHPAVREAVVTPHESADGDKRLVAYVVPKGDLSPSTSELRSFLKQMLPDYMIPSAFVTLQVLPLTPNGKVNRTALPQPDPSRRDVEQASVAPRNSVEEALARIWAELLELERVGVHDNFFELGGHSLLAIRVVSRIRSAFDLILPLRTLFDNPTVAGMAIQLAQAQAAAVVPQEMAKTLAELEALSEDEAQRLLSDKQARQP